MDNPLDGRIFISYRRTDSAGYAGRIYDRLTAHFGADAVFMDVDTIEAGVDFVEVLQNAVQSCDVLVALIGRRWLDIKDETGKRRLDNPEDFVRVEIAAALSRDIRLIPVLVDGVPMPRSTELPVNVKPLARRNALQVNHHSFNADAQRLISQLELAMKAAEDSKILKAKAMKEAQERAQRQAEIERLLKTADLAITLKDWKLAQEKLSIVLKSDADHLEAQSKLVIVQRKIHEIEGDKEKAKKNTREKEERERKEREEKMRLAKEAREKEEAEERARLIKEQKAKQEREERERKAAEEKTKKEGEDQENKKTATLYDKLPAITPSQQLKNEKSARTLNWRLYGIGGAVILALTSLIFGGTYLYRNFLALDEPPLTEPVITRALEDLPPPTENPEELGVGSTMTSDKDGMTMVYVPAGEFQMGIESGNSDEKTVHTVYLDAFWIDQTEVTNAMYTKCVMAEKCNPPSLTRSSSHYPYYENPVFRNYPVLYVSWYDANAYCSWTERELPSEAQWEKAASWDEETREHRLYPWGGTIDAGYANYSNNVGDTTVVGGYKKGVSYYGAYDMAGNLWEWTSSLYQDYPYDAEDGRELISSAGLRVLRGGSWRSIRAYLSSAFRNRVDPSNTNNDIGFRCARDATP